MTAPSFPTSQPSVVAPSKPRRTATFGCIVLGGWILLAGLAVLLMELPRLAKPNGFGKVFFPCTVALISCLFGAALLFLATRFRTNGKPVFWIVAGLSGLLTLDAAYLFVVLLKMGSPLALIFTTVRLGLCIMTCAASIVAALRPDPQSTALQTALQS